MLDQTTSSCCNAGDKDMPQRRLNLSAIPTETEIANIEFDITLNCNLRCRYCYKGEVQKVDMPRRVAFDAVNWLIHASGQQKDLSIFFLGGEPLMNFSLIRELVPYGITRARQHGKTLTFGITTNGTLVTDEIIDFCRKWNVTFHTSFDGIPEIQNKNRPTASGGPSSHLVEAGVRKILAYLPGTSARCTFDAENAHYLFDNDKYFRSLGYQSIIMIPALSAVWREDVLEELKQNYRKIADYWMDETRKEIMISFKHFDDFFTNRQREKRGTVPCGSGRGYGMINGNGDYYPCSRWGIHEKETWSFGNIYESFHEEKRKEFLKGFPEESFLPECDSCEARCLCSGGCLAENLDTVGNPYAIIPMGCEIMKIWTKVGQHILDTMLREENQDFIMRYCPENMPHPCSCQKDQEQKFENAALYGQPVC